jgi:hypothetical protein
MPAPNSRSASKQVAGGLQLSGHRTRAFQDLLKFPLIHVTLLEDE